MTLKIEDLWKTIMLKMQKMIAKMQMVKHFASFKNHDHVNVDNKMLLLMMMERTISKINLSGKKS